MALDDLEGKIIAFEAIDFKQELTNVIEDNTEFLLDLQTSQLAHGIDANNEPIYATVSASYSPYTKDLKKKYGTGLGAVTDRVTNYMTGAMYDSMTKKVEGDKVETDSNVGYFAERKQWSGEKAFDLNESYRREFAEEKVIPCIQNIVNVIFGK